jgi:hypothetical protein
MKNRRNALFAMAMTCAVMPATVLVASDAWAQTAPAVQPMQALTPLAAVIMVGTFLVGFLTNMATTGKILGQVPLPLTVLPWLLLGAAFIGGALPVLTTATGFTSTVLVNAVVMGLVNMVGYAAGTSAHAHTQSSDNAQTHASVKKLVADSMARAGRAAVVLLMAGALALGGATVSACGMGGVVGPAADCTVAILTDAINGLSIPQIEADVKSRCGQDLAAIIAVLLGSQDAKVQASPAYAQAAKIQAAIMAMHPAVAPVSK